MIRKLWVMGYLYDGDTIDNEVVMVTMAEGRRTKKKKN